MNETDIRQQKIKLLFEKNILEKLQKYKLYVKVLKQILIKMNMKHLVC